MPKRLHEFSPTLGFIVMLGIFAFHFIAPIRVIFPYPLNFIGLVPVIAGVVLNLLADIELRSKGSVSRRADYENCPETLITSGIYRYTRNPVYLGHILIVVGLAFWVGSLSPWCIVILYFGVLRQVFIREEERQLEDVFGYRYQQYYRLVPRWFCHSVKKINHK